MKITIMPDTEEEKKHVPMMEANGVQSLGFVAIYAKSDPELEPLRHGFGNLAQVMRELPLLNFVLTENMLIAGAAARAKQAQPRIAIAPPDFDPGNNRLKLQ